MLPRIYNLNIKIKKKRKGKITLSINLDKKFISGKEILLVKF